jgi:hypothetical protein
METFSLSSVNDVEFIEQYQVKMSNRSAALENSDDDDMDINRALSYRDRQSRLL